MPVGTSPVAAFCSGFRVFPATETRRTNPRMKSLRREGVRQNAYRCVVVAARNRENQLRPPSPLCPVVTRRSAIQQPIKCWVPIGRRPSQLSALSSGTFCFSLGCTFDFRTCCACPREWRALNHETRQDGTQYRTISAFSRVHRGRVGGSWRNHPGRGRVHRQPSRDQGGEGFST